MSISKSAMGVLFELDGVLIDTLGYHQLAFLTIGGTYGFNSEEVVKAREGNQTLRGVYAALQKIRPFAADYTQFAKNVHEVLFGMMERDGFASDPTLCSFLRDLKKHGCKLAVVTPNILSSTERKLAMVGLANQFDALITDEDVAHQKPKPDPFIEAAKRLGVLPDHCVVIENGQKGVEGAKRAGMKTIGFTQYLEHKDELGEADMVVDSFNELGYKAVSDLSKY
jgi:beta-phosphoglucomutase